MIAFDVTRRVGNPRWRRVDALQRRSVSSPPRPIRRPFDSLPPPIRGPIEERAMLLNRDYVRENKRHQMLYRAKEWPTRRVPAFTIQTEQANTKPLTPSVAAGQRRRRETFAFSTPRKVNPFKDENLRNFLRLYEDRRFPIRVVSTGLHQRRRLEWQIDAAQLSDADRRELLRRFAAGIAVEKEPYAFIAVQGIRDLLSTANMAHLVAESMIELIPNLRKGLDSRNSSKKLDALDLLNTITQLPGIGPLLVPYYRMLLPPLRLVSGAYRNTSVSTDISSGSRDRLPVAIDRTLATLEQTGGENALINIKYLIPQYQSCSGEPKSD